MTSQSSPRSRSNPEPPPPPPDELEPLDVPSAPPSHELVAPAPPESPRPTLIDPEPDPPPPPESWKPPGSRPERSTAAVGRRHTCQIQILISVRKAPNEMSSAIG